MKIYIIVTAIFLCGNTYGQKSDSLNEIQEVNSVIDSMLGKVQGKMLPGFTAVDLNGKMYTNADLKEAKATFINLWFISCPPCIAEIPNLNRLYGMMKDSSDFQFFAITMEPESKLKDAIAKYDIHFPVLMTTHKTTTLLTFGRGYPTSFIVDKEGKVCSSVSGGSLKPGPELETYFMQEIEKLRNPGK
jgi:peroxiredoxin